MQPNNVYFLYRYQGVGCVVIARNYHLNASLKVVYLSKMFDRHDAMLNDSRFSTPNCRVFLNGLRIISIISTTCQIDTNKDNQRAQTWTVSYCINSKYGIKSELCREQ